MKKNTTPVRGTNDYLPQEMAIREKVRNSILNTCKSYGFMQIGTPILENIDNLLDSDGGDNLKLIFKVLKRGDKLDLTQPNLTENDIVDIGLKYDQTVPLVRLFSNNQNLLPTPFKTVQIDSSFRAERPQKGRFRQFTQCDIDILGDNTCNAEIEILTTVVKALENLNFKNITIKINDKKIITSLINLCGFLPEQTTNICISLDKLDKIGIEGVSQELISSGFDAQKVAQLLQTITLLKENNDKYCELLPQYAVNQAVIDNFDCILSSVRLLTSKNVNIIFDPTIIRGQNYYTGTVYEIFLDGMSSACGGGGRYDKMIDKMIGQDVPAVGFGMGFERICLLLQESNMIDSLPNNLALMYDANDDFVEVLKYLQTINTNQNVSAILTKKNFAHQLEILKANGFTKFCLFKDKKIKNL